MPIIHSLDETKHHPFVTPGMDVFLFGGRFGGSVDGCDGRADRHMKRGLLLSFPRCLDRSFRGGVFGRKLGVAKGFGTDWRDRGAELSELPPPHVRRIQGA